MYIITRKHFETIVKHCQEAYPSEAGGFLGGRDNLILGIYPVFNLAFLHFSEKEEFALADGEIIKVHSYFEKHNMKVMGFYHSHPSASFPIPSEKDIMTHKLKHLKGMMIVSLYDLKNTIMAIYNIEGNTPVEQDIKIIEDNEVNKYL